MKFGIPITLVPSAFAGRKVKTDFWSDSRGDVSVQHQQMKKNRPGFLVRALARPSDRLALARILFEDSTAIGVRATESERIVLAREARRVATPYGRIRIKLIRDDAGHAAVSAEYDDCKRAARRAGVPLRDVVRAAEEAGRAALD